MTDTIGILGGGQLGRMLTLEAKRMGYRVVTLEPLPNSPCGQVADEQIVAAYDDLRAIGELGARSDVVTYEFENIPVTALDALARAGCRVTSLHPMFGPDTQLLSGRHVIFIDMGHAGALKDAQDLFASTMAERVVMSLDEHDRLIAYVLGLSHALNIAFFTALAESGEAAPKLARMSSTTFDAQLDVAVLGELHRVGQRLVLGIGPDRGIVDDRLRAQAVERLLAAVRTKDAAAFTALMNQGRAYFDVRAQARAG